MDMLYPLYDTNFVYRSVLFLLVLFCFVAVCSVLFLLFGAVRVQCSVLYSVGFCVCIYIYRTLFIYPPTTTALSLKQKIDSFYIQCTRGRICACHAMLCYAIIIKRPHPPRAR